MDELRHLARSHRSAFERIYSEVSSRIPAITFPLEQIDKYDWNRGPYGNELYSYYYRRFTAYILALLNVEDGQRILNIGCGFGFEEKNLQNLYGKTKLYSIDISLSMLLTAKRTNCPSSLCLALAEELPFRDESFDLVVSREVIEHVISPAIMLQEVCRCLKPEGMAVITTEYESSLAPGHAYSKIQKKLLFPVFGIPVTGPEYKQRPPTVREFKALARSCGLVVERIIWDGAMYQLLGSLFCQRFFKSRVERIARFYSRLENSGSVDRLFCDQVKFVVRKPKEAICGQVVLDEWTEEPKSDGAAAGRMSLLLYRCTDALLGGAFNSIVFVLATLLVVYRKITGRPSLEKCLEMDGRLRKYLLI